MRWYPPPPFIAAQLGRRWGVDVAGNPRCRCTDPIEAFFCSTGHMTECHFPMRCADAQCSQLARYDTRELPEPLD